MPNNRLTLQRDWPADKGDTASELQRYEEMLRLAIEAGMAMRAKQAEGMPASAQMLRDSAPVPNPDGFTPLTPWERPGMPDSLAYSPMPPPAPPIRPSVPKPGPGGEVYLQNPRGSNIGSDYAQLYEAMDLFGRTPRGRPF